MEQDPSTELEQPTAVQPPPIPPLRQNAAVPPPISPAPLVAAVPVAPRATRPAYPKPPSLFRHIALLCIRPDQWAQAARYPMHVTLIPVALTIIVASIFLSINSATNSIEFMRQFAQKYDKQFAPLTFSKGLLSGQATADKKLPHFNLKLPGPLQPMNVLFDPKAQAASSATDAPPSWIFTDRALISPGSTMTYDRMKELLGSPADPITINSAGIKTFLQTYKWVVALYIGAMMFLWAMVRNIAWALLTAFLVTPFVQLAGQRVGIPFRVAWRIAFSITVPLIILGAFLEIMDMPLSDTFGADVTSIIWTGMAAGMAIWAGLIAKTMYAPPRRTAPRRGM